MQMCLGFETSCSVFFLSFFSLGRVFLLFVLSVLCFCKCGTLYSSDCVAVTCVLLLIALLRFLFWCVELSLGSTFSCAYSSGLNKSIRCVCHLNCSLHKELLSRYAFLLLVLYTTRNTTQHNSGLRYLNEQKQKVIHYDLKPGNILFTSKEYAFTTRTRTHTHSLILTRHCKMPCSHPKHNTQTGKPR